MNTPVDTCRITQRIRHQLRCLLSPSANASPSTPPACPYSYGYFSDSHSRSQASLLLQPHHLRHAYITHNSHDHSSHIFAFEPACTYSYSAQTLSHPLAPRSCTPMTLAPPHAITCTRLRSIVAMAFQSRYTHFHFHISQYGLQLSSSTTPEQLSLLATHFA